MVETIEILKRAKALSYNAPLSSEIKNKLQNSDLSKLSKLNAEDILKKLR